MSKKMPKFYLKWITNLVKKYGNNDPYIKVSYGLHYYPIKDALIDENGNIIIELTGESL